MISAVYGDDCVSLPCPDYSEGDEVDIFLPVSMMMPQLTKTSKESRDLESLYVYWRSRVNSGNFDDRFISVEVTDFNPNFLIPTQYELSALTVIKYCKCHLQGKVDEPTAVKFSNSLDAYIMDGHHRISSHLTLYGLEPIKVKLFSFDESLIF